MKERSTLLPPKRKEHIKRRRKRLLILKHFIFNLQKPRIWTLNGNMSYIVFRFLGSMAAVERNFGIFQCQLSLAGITARLFLLLLLMVPHFLLMFSHNIVHIFKNLMQRAPLNVLTFHYCLCAVIGVTHKSQMVRTINAVLHKYFYILIIQILSL